MGKLILTSGVNIFGNKIWRPAPSAWLSALAELTPAEVAINAAGEVLPGAFPTPAALADWIASGGVWADYTSWPMYRAEVRGGSKFIGPEGFGDFLRAAGLWFPHTFQTAEFRYPRSLNTSDGELPMWVSVDATAPYATPGFRIVSSFGIKINKGWYFYAFASTDAVTAGDHGIPPAVFAGFVTAMLRAQPPPVSVALPDPGALPGAPPSVDPGDGDTVLAPSSGLWDRMTPTGRAVTVGLGAAAIVALVAVMGRREP